MYRINTIPSKAAKEKGSASYPEDFPHLKPGEDFTAWKVGEDWEIETTLGGDALQQRLEESKMDYNKELVHELCKYYNIELKETKGAPTYKGKAFDGGFISGLFKGPTERDSIMRASKIEWKIEIDGAKWNLKLKINGKEVNPAWAELESVDLENIKKEIAEGYACGILYSFDDGQQYVGKALGELINDIIESDIPKIFPNFEIHAMTPSGFVDLKIKDMRNLLNGSSGYCFDIDGEGAPCMKGEILSQVISGVNRYSNKNEVGFGMITDNH